MSTRLAMAVLALFVLAGVLGPWLAPLGNRVDLDQVLAGPQLSAAGWMGFDELGRPLVVRVLVAARGALLVAGGTVALGAGVGVLVGLVAGLRRGPWDATARQVMDAVQAFPGLVLAIALAGVLGAGNLSALLALAAVGWVGFARLARGQALTLGRSEHVQAARALGCGEPSIVLRHLLPLAGGPLLAHGAGALAGALMAQAGLAFLGLGAPPPAPAWGGMLREGMRYLPVAPHYVLVPGLVLFAVVLAAGVCADALRDRYGARRT